MVYRLFAVPSWGSALVEAMLAQAGQVPELVDVEGFDQPGPARDALLAVNPLAQIPTLVLPDGEVMTESAAIALLLAERHPEARLAPPPGAPDRPAFLRKLIWLVVNVYTLATYADYPERFVRDEAPLLLESALRRREDLWRQFERELPGGDWVLGARFSALDIYVAVMSHWRPRRPWFAEHAPNLLAIAHRVDRHPQVGPVMSRNFPGEN